MRELESKCPMWIDACAHIQTHTHMYTKNGTQKKNKLRAQEKRYKKSGCGERLRDCRSALSVFHSVEELKRYAEPKVPWAGFRSGPYNPPAKANLSGSELVHCLHYWMQPPNYTQPHSPTHLHTSARAHTHSVRRSSAQRKQSTNRKKQLVTHTRTHTRTHTSHLHLNGAQFKTVGA